MIFTNQLRMKIGVMFGNPEVTSGGQALKFYSSVRIDMRKIGNIQEGDEIIGTRHRARIVKNKVAPPFKTAEFDMLADSGISEAGGILDVAADLGVVVKSGSFFKYKDDTIAQGRQNAINFLTENEPTMLAIKKEIWQKIKSDRQANKKTS